MFALLVRSAQAATDVKELDDDLSTDDDELRWLDSDHVEDEEAISNDRTLSTIKVVQMVSCVLLAVGAAILIIYASRQCKRSKAHSCKKKRWYHIRCCGCIRYVCMGGAGTNNRTDSDGTSKGRDPLRLPLLAGAPRATYASDGGNSGMLGGVASYFLHIEDTVSDSVLEDEGDEGEKEEEGQLNEEGKEVEGGEGGESEQNCLQILERAKAHAEGGPAVLFVIHRSNNSNCIVYKGDASKGVEVPPSM
jgi:hypothetical protein